MAFSVEAEMPQIQEITVYVNREVAVKARCTMT